MYCGMWRPRYICFTISSNGRDWQISFIDSDKIELSNLNRQVMFIESDIGKNKAEVLKTYIQKINPQARIIVSKKNVSKKT